MSRMFNGNSRLLFLILGESLKARTLPRIHLHNNQIKATATPTITVADEGKWDYMSFDRGKERSVVWVGESEDHFPVHELDKNLPRAVDWEWDETPPTLVSV